MADPADWDTMQRLLLWRLAVAEGGGMFLKNLESDPGAARRGTLLKAGLIASEKRKTPKGSTAGFLTLTDAGWGWCQGHLGDDLPGRAVKADRAVLERLLKLLGRSLRATGGSFGTLILAAEEPDEDTTDEPTDEPDRGREVIAACRAAGGGQAGVRVRLSDLRPRLPDLPRGEVDGALLALERAGELVLDPLEDPLDVRPADREAALLAPLGGVRHLVRLRV